jgi:hypothetical protein
MPGKARSAERVDDAREQGNGAGKSGGAVATRERHGLGIHTEGASLWVDMPLMSAQFRAPHLPGREEIGSAASSVRSMVPSPTSMLFYGGLALTAALGVIEWPVAVAVGAGTALASRAAAGPASQAGTDRGERQPESE